MDINVFPLVTQQMSVKQAFEELKFADRSALVVNDGTRYAFVQAPHIVFAMARRTARVLKPLMERTPLQVFPTSTLSGNQLDFRKSPNLKAMEQYMDDAGVRFVLVALAPGRAVVASRSEDDMAPAIATPRDCYCETDEKAVSPGVDGGDCPHNRRHKGTVVCC